MPAAAQKQDPIAEKNREMNDYLKQNPTALAIAQFVVTTPDSSSSLGVKLAKPKAEFKGDATSTMDISKYLTGQGITRQKLEGAVSNWKKTTPVIVEGTAMQATDVYVAPTTKQSQPSAGVFYDPFVVGGKGKGKGNANVAETPANAVEITQAPVETFTGTSKRAPKQQAETTLHFESGAAGVMAFTDLPQSVRDAIITTYKANVDPTAKPLDVNLKFDTFLFNSGVTGLDITLKNGLVTGMTSFQNSNLTQTPNAATLTMLKPGQAFVMSSTTTVPGGVQANPGTATTQGPPVVSAIVDPEGLSLSSALAYVPQSKWDQFNQAASTGNGTAMANLMDWNMIEKDKGGQFRQEMESMVRSLNPSTMTQQQYNERISQLNQYALNSGFDLYIDPASVHFESQPGPMVLGSGWGMLTSNQKLLDQTGSALQKGDFKKIGELLNNPESREMLESMLANSAQVDAALAKLNKNDFTGFVQLLKPEFQGQMLDTYQAKADQRTTKTSEVVYRPFLDVETGQDAQGAMWRMTIAQREKAEIVRVEEVDPTTGKAKLLYDERLGVQRDTFVSGVFNVTEDVKLLVGLKEGKQDRVYGGVIVPIVNKIISESESGEAFTVARVDLAAYINPDKGGFQPELTARAKIEYIDNDALIGLKYNGKGDLGAMPGFGASVGLYGGRTGKWQVGIEAPTSNLNDMTYFLGTFNTKESGRGNAGIYVKPGSGEVGIQFSMDKGGSKDKSAKAGWPNEAAPGRMKTGEPVITANTGAYDEFFGQ